MTIKSSVFENNTAWEGGGSFLVNPKKTGIMNSLFVNNVSSSSAGGLELRGCWDGTISNCVFYGNRSSSSAGGFLLNNSVRIRSVNNIFENNDVQEDAEILVTNMQNPNVTTELELDHCAVNQSGVAVVGDRSSITFGDGLISEPPGMRDPDRGDFRLHCGSPCINTGSPDLDVDEDLDGNLRPIGNAVDIGAYEFQTEYNPGVYLMLEYEDKCRLFYSEDQAQTWIETPWIFPLEIKMILNLAGENSGSTHGLKPR